MLTKKQTTKIDTLRKEYFQYATGKEQLLKLISETEVFEQVYNSNAIENSTLSIEETEKILLQIDLDRYVTKTMGILTLKDIKDELAKPGRDPREPFKLFSFKEGVEKIEDLSAGMKLAGVVTNITAFGVFVDVGVHHDGLIHISKLSTRYIKDPNDVVKVHQKIDVTVIEVDLPRKRIALSSQL